MRATLIFALMFMVGMCYAQSQEKKVVTLENGQFEEYTVLEDGTLSYALFTANGVLLETGFFADKERDGQWITYDASGNKTAKMHYNKGLKDGDMFIWSNLGVLLYKIEYAEGVRIAAYHYTTTGEVIAQRD